MYSVKIMFRSGGVNYCAIYRGDILYCENVCESKALKLVSDANEPTIKDANKARLKSEKQRAYRVKNIGRLREQDREYKRKKRAKLRDIKLAAQKEKLILMRKGK